MKFRASVLDEPLLEFGGGGREIDIRFGLMRHGPLEPERASRVRLGVIGTNETIEGFSRFLDRCQVGIGAKPSRQPNLFLPFPGLANENPFRCAFEVDPRARKPIPRSDITQIVTIKSNAEAIEEAVTLFAAQAQAIAEAPGPPDVIICALPFELISRVLPDSGLARHADGEDDQTQDHTVAPDFRDLLKARTIHLKRPLQIVWPTTWEDGGRIVRQLSEDGQPPRARPCDAGLEPLRGPLLQGRIRSMAAAARSIAIRHIVCWDQLLSGYQRSALAHQHRPDVRRTRPGSDPARRTGAYRQAGSAALPFPHRRLRPVEKVPDRLWRPPLPRAGESDRL